MSAGAEADVLSVLAFHARAQERTDYPRLRSDDELEEARAAVAELIAASRDAAAVLQTKAGPLEQETPRRLYAALARVQGGQS